MTTPQPVQPPKPAPPPPADALTRLRQDLDRALAALARLERRR